MQVSVEKLDGLERRITVQVPAETIEPEVLNRLKSLSPTVKLHGFRPGKVPLKLVKRLYGEQVRHEVVQEVVRSSYQDALKQENLRPAGAPTIEPRTIKEGEALEYSATFEVLPDFEVKGLDEIQVERPEVEIGEADVDRMLENLRKQRVSWNPVERPAQDGDQLTIDYKGYVEGREEPVSEAEGSALTLEENTFQDFREKLTGLQADGETIIETTYPTDYQSAELAGKTVRYQVKVRRVAEPMLPAVDEEFARQLGVTEGGVEALRQAVRDNMQRELDERIRSRLRQQLMDGLLAANDDIPLPQALVKNQVDSMAMQLGLRAADDAATEELKGKLFEPEARRRSAFGLILMKLAETQGIQVDEARVRDQLARLAAGYEHGADMLRLYERDPGAMQGVRSLTLQDQVVDWLLERVQATPKPTTFEDIMKPAAAAPAQE